MLELFRNAWMGWGAYIQYGKLAALFLAVLLLLWFWKKGTEQKAFVLYASVMAVLCIFPVTAGLLMWYQTRFYDYEWIWSAVPVTALTAFGITLFLAELWSGTEKEQRRKAGVVTALVLAVLVLGGGLGTGKWDSDGQQEERARAYRILEQINSVRGEAEICLWAPAEVMEYAREADAEIRLLYGRNMWDISLNGYSYDVYEDWKTELYEWMEQADEMVLAVAEDLGATDSTSQEKVREYAQMALGGGVNCVLLPGGTDEKIVQEMAEVFGARPQRIEEYWMIYE